ncbi:MAG: carboxylesterase family protein [Microbacterium sp.]
MVTVDTQSGPVSGLRLGHADTWLGIPYAAPPIGDLRFCAPQPVTGWSEPRSAVTFGAAAPQPDPIQQRATPSTTLATGLMSLLYPFSGSPVGDCTMDEDCLVLNVWAPTNLDEPCPVMVWLHGGAFLHGAGSEPAFWGDRLAARQNVVVVTINHRLGALGYLPLGDDGAGQAGMLDLVMALEWVRDNIVAFGGDPRNVTIFGQSGGGMKVATLMAMPSAAGLFHKAIVMSGPTLRLPRPAENEALASALCTALGVDDGDMNALRSVPVERLVSAQYAAMAMTGGAMLGWSPVVDGRHIVGDPLSSTATSAPDVPLLTGCTTEEAGMFLAMDPEYSVVDAQTLPSRLAGDFGDDAERILAEYRAAFPTSDAKGLLRRIISDRDVRVSAGQFAEYKASASDAAVYTYLFDYDSGVLDGAIGATHSGELSFVFDNADRIPLSGIRSDRDALGASMSAAFAAFARTGDPSTPTAAWPPLSRNGATMVFDGARPHVVEHVDRERLEMMSQYPSQLFERGSGSAHGELVIEQPQSGVAQGPA